MTRSHLPTLSSLAMTAAILALAATAAAQSPSLGDVTPAVAGVKPGVIQTLTFTANFPDTSYYLEFDVSMSWDNSPRCYFALSGVYTMSLYLFDDNGTNPIQVPFGSGSASNSSCQINGAGSSYSLDSNGNLTLTVNFTFPAAVAGRTFSYTEQASSSNPYASDTSGWWQMPGASL